MTMVFFWGLLFGFVFASIGHMLLMSQYHGILIERANDKKPECIDGNFYYIIPEEDYVIKGG